MKCTTTGIDITCGFSYLFTYALRTLQIEEREGEEYARTWWHMRGCHYHSSNIFSFKTMVWEWHTFENIKTSLLRIICINQNVQRLSSHLDYISIRFRLWNFQMHINLHDWKKVKQKMHHTKGILFSNNYNWIMDNM